MTRIPSVMTESTIGFFFRPQALWQMVRLLGHLRNLVVHSNLQNLRSGHNSALRGVTDGFTNDRLAAADHPQMQGSFALAHRL